MIKCTRPNGSKMLAFLRRRYPDQVQGYLSARSGTPSFSIDFENSLNN